MDTDIRPRRTLAATLRAHVANPLIRWLLRTPGHRVLSGSVLLLAYTGRRSGVRRELPVMYAGLGDRLVAVAGQPDSKTWWRNFVVDPQPVTVTVAGRRVRCRAQLLEPRTVEHQRALDVYRARYPRVQVDDSSPVILLTPTATPDR
jgi:deazaflavin-dependent oxidoreductase (nitroreductase family)